VKKHGNELNEANPAPWSRTQEPTYTPDGHDSTRVDHPCFGMIGAARVNGGTFLYGSDFQHNAFVRVTVRESCLRRSLSTDWPHGNKELIEIDLSEAQWAEFVSAMNIGFGTQCTIRHVQHEFRPGLPKPERRADQFAREAADDMRESLEALADLSNAIDALKLSEKQKEVLRGHVHTSRSRLTSGLPFVAKLFAEHMESTVSKAKMEINAYGSNMLIKTGMQALADKQPPAITFDTSE
jgi:hypothetical protein